ncbi:PREDICTED: uncharacterized protein LOC108449074 [Corvus brachyrhynchos]|uniref:uncharacterized protein LOC108449074 n=1 Tax=Corvus brachyrhynchos TaxID=85066 RepID=UPI00053553E7|nr:PREDICTED: uncharacterized protein LOC108449074 [Corvus brachyrhynchos]
MRPLRINRAGPGCLLHSELKAALGITLSPWTSHRPEGSTDSGNPRSDLQQLELPLGKGFQRHQPNSELRKGDILGMAVSAPESGRAFAAPAKSPQQDYPDGQCPRAALQFPFHGRRNAGEAELPLPKVTGGTWGLWIFLGTHLQPPASCKTSSTEAIPKPREALAVQVP